MRITDIARRAGRSLRNSKTRTILTSLAIAVGAFTITVSLAAGEGARQYTEKLVSSNVNPQALFIVKDSQIFEAPGNQGVNEYNPDVTSSYGTPMKMMTQEDIDKLSQRDDIEQVTPTYNPEVKYFTIDGSDKKFTSSVAMYDSTISAEVAKGTGPAKGENLKDDQIIVPQSYAKELVDLKAIANEDQLIGKKITLYASGAKQALDPEKISAALASGDQQALMQLVGQEEKSFTFTVAALSTPSSTALSGGAAIQVSANKTREIVEFTTKGTELYQKYFGVTALTKEGKDPAAVKDAIQKDLGYSAQTAKDLQSVLFTIVTILQGIVLGFGVIALIASVFGIINTQYISVLERTREIGLMKALGMRGRAVSRLFQFEAAWIGFLGGLIGAGIAVILGLALNPWITSALSLGEGNAILIFQPIPIALMIVALMIIAMLAGWFPARKAAKLDPIEALRTE